MKAVKRAKARPAKGKRSIRERLPLEMRQVLEAAEAEERPDAEPGEVVVRLWPRAFIHPKNKQPYLKWTVSALPQAFLDLPERGTWKKMGRSWLVLGQGGRP